MYWTSTDIIESLRIRGIIPRAQNAFDNARFLQIMTEEMIYYLVPTIMTAREHYFLTYEDIPLVANQSEYEIPSRAIAQKVKAVWYVNSSGQTRRLVMRDAERELYYQNQTASQPREYYFKDTKIVCMPDIGTPDGSLRVYYYKRPNQIVELTAVGQVTQVVGDVVTLNNVPTTFSATAQYDIVKGKPNFVNLLEESTPTSLVGDAITFTDLPTTVEVGDYVCLTGQSPIPQVPYETFRVLIMKALMIVLRGQNDVSGSDRAEKDWQMAEREMLNLIAERSDDDSKSIQSDRGLGALFMGGGGFYDSGW